MRECTASGMVARIKQAMAARRYSLRKLSNNTKISYRTLQNYMLEKHPIPAETLGKICAEMGVSADWVMFDNLYVDLEMMKEALHRTSLVMRTGEPDNAVASGLLVGALNLLNDSAMTPDQRAWEAVHTQLEREAPKGHSELEEK